MLQNFQTILTPKRRMTKEENMFFTRSKTPFIYPTANSSESLQESLEDKRKKRQTADIQVSIWECGRY